MDVTQVRLIVSDFPAMFRFYRDVMQLKPQFDDDSGPYAAFSPDNGSKIALHAQDALAATVADLAPAGGDRSLIALRVDDVDQAVAELRERGANPTEPAALGDRIRAAYLRDPEGNLLELQQWLVT
jgi:catechol 2,3-dioxygenase-like lactoylglutathione lyase family enzyme